MNTGAGRHRRHEASSTRGIVGVRHRRRGASPTRGIADAGIADAGHRRNEELL